MDRHFCPAQRIRPQGSHETTHLKWLLVLFQSYFSQSRQTAMKAIKDNSYSAMGPALWTMPEEKGPRKLNETLVVILGWFKFCPLPLFVSRESVTESPLRIPMSRLVTIFLFVLFLSRQNWANLRSLEIRKNAFLTVSHTQ